MKVVRTAAIIVAVAAAVVVTAGAVLPAIGIVGFAAGFTALTGLTMAAVSAIGTVAGILASITAKKPKIGGSGSQTTFMADPAAGIPYAIGRTGLAGNIVHQGSYGGTDNPYQSFVIAWSGGGPHDSFEQFYVDKVATNFSGGAATGNYASFMWLDTQLGACPESTALTTPVGGFGGWDSSSKLSGYGVGLWTLKVDPKGKKYASGVPKPLMVGKWAKVYDPRLDSTYPGGSGPHRALDETTYEWSENPWLHALTWALGRWQNGKRVLGVGVPISSIDVAAYVEAANIADVNGWKVGGVVYSTDDKWAVMKAMCQAGGGEPMRLGALLSCFVNTPRVSLATITADDLADGDISVTAMQPRRDRINGVISRWRSEEHDWEIVSSDPAHVADYVTEDGGERTREVEFTLVQDKDQAAQLGMYEVVNAREFGPITMPLKPYWIGYKPGDCLTVAIDETGMESQDVIVMGRNFDPATGAVTPTMRSETAAKHAFALGQTGTAPPTPSLSAPPAEPFILERDIAQLIGTSRTEPTVILEATESAGSVTVTLIDHDRFYADGVRTPVTGATFTGLSPATAYWFYYDDLTRAVTAPTIVETTVVADAQSNAAPGRHCLGRIKTPDSGTGDMNTGGGQYSPGVPIGGEIP